MKIPKNRLRFIHLDAGRGVGTLVINVRGLDLEGVSELEVARTDIDAVIAPEAESDASVEARRLLGG